MNFLTRAYLDLYEPARLEISKKRIAGKTITYPACKEEK